MRKRRKRALAITIAILPALFATVLTAAPALAHGAMMVPGSRTFLCWKDGLTPQGNIVPQNPACAAAVGTSGDNSLYNWFSVLRSDGAGRTRGFISDGQLCSGGNPNFTGFNVARADFPVTHLTSGADLGFRYNKWAAHPGWFYLYITKDSWSPTRPLAWNDLEEQPFAAVDHPADTGAVGSVDGYYYWNARLPSGKSGRHIIYSVWQRSDSNETFYGCSDVVFDGGNGQVTGIGQGGGGGGGGGGTPPPATGACTATYTTTGSWSGGFQAEVKVTNTGTSALNGWTVSWPLATGQAVNSVWNGSYTPGGSVATVRNVSWNRSVAPGGSATFGLSANGATSAPAVNCTSP